MTCETVNFESAKVQPSLLVRTVGQLQARLQLRKDRAEFAKILKLDDHMLSDIGVNRGAVEWAQSLPTSKNPGLELAKTVGRIGKINLG